jgi:hypothetical protein
MNEQSILAAIGEFILSLFMNKENEKNGKLAATELAITVPLEKEPPSKTLEQNSPNLEYPPNIDWTNPEAKISKFFTVKEACWLPSWSIMHIPSEEEKQNIIKQAAKMDLIRGFFGVSIRVHCWIRPILNNPNSEFNGKDYNALVKGAKNSAHKVGLATDYDVEGLNCDDVRAKLEPKLEQWQIRMEKMPGSDWIHNDCAPVIAYRYFNP